MVSGMGYHDGVPANGGWRDDDVGGDAQLAQRLLVLVADHRDGVGVVGELDGSAAYRSFKYLAVRVITAMEGEQVGDVVDVGDGAQRRL